MNRRKIGAAYEEAAAVFLEKNGVHILEKNFRCRQGEIDLIGRDGEYLVFFEVKYRKSADLGLPAEAVGAAKQRRICGKVLFISETSGRERSGTVRCGRGLRTAPELVPECFQLYRKVRPCRRKRRYG